MSQPAPTSAPSTGKLAADSGHRPGLQLGLLLLAVISFLLVFHNYGHPFLPQRHFVIPSTEMVPYAADNKHVFVFAFDHGEPNRAGIDRSALVILEDGKPYPDPQREPAGLMIHGGTRWMHQTGRVLFAASDNSDPRSNGRAYTLISPILYSRTVGLGALAVLILSSLGLVWLRRKLPFAADTATLVSSWRTQVALAGVLFLGGLYCNTGTLTPYAITTAPHVAKNTGYLYNPDHIHFRALSDFVQGDPRPRWDGNIMLRRILFPVLAWPFIKVAGFEIGGTLASLALNLAAFLWAAHLLRTRIGERGTLVGLWLLALYPGAAYWAGLPYPYALICPLSLLLLIGLHDLQEARGRKLVLLSLAMGFAYLAYDFTAFFVPAAFLLLRWRRRFWAAVLSCGIQIAPVALWVFCLSNVFHQNLANSNTNTYQAILGAYRSDASLAYYWGQLHSLPETLLQVFFGANFLFLPGLFLLLLAVNPVTSRVRLQRPELVLLFVAFGIFLFNHFAPPYGGWQMRGSWISRIYQPIYPVFILFAARWWQHLPPLRTPIRWLLGGTLAAFSLGNALIVFGPILNNPLKVSEAAFYRFYDHNEHFFYEEISLKNYGRHPLGFPAKKP